MSKKNIQTIAKNEFAKLSKIISKLKFAVELDESKVVITEKSVGGKVEIKNDDGTLAIIEDGEYKVGDFQFKTEGGFIVEIIENVEMVDEAEVIAVDEAANNSQVLIDELKDTIEQLESTNEVLVEEVDALKEGFRALYNAFSKISVESNSAQPQETQMSKSQRIAKLLKTKK